MKKTILWILFAILSGAIIGSITIDKYDKYEKAETLTTFVQDSDVYALYYGTYDTLEEAEDELYNIGRYIYKEENNKVYIYIAICKTHENALKLKKIYIKDYPNISIVRININNETFIKDLIEYEKLLTLTEEENSINIIENKILTSYKDLVIGNE